MHLERQQQIIQYILKQIFIQLKMARKIEL